MTNNPEHKGEYSWIHLKEEQAAMGMEDREDNPRFLTPPGKWLTIVTDIGEVLGFEIVRDVQ